MNGSSRCSNAVARPGSQSVSALRPPPGARTRAPPACGSGGVAESSSLTPARTVPRDIPVASATRVIPPRPMARASAAAHRRRVRSSNSGPNRLYFPCTACVTAFMTPEHSRLAAKNGHIILAGLLSVGFRPLPQTNPTRGGWGWRRNSRAGGRRSASRPLAHRALGGQGALCRVVQDLGGHLGEQPHVVSGGDCAPTSDPLHREFASRGGVVSSRRRRPRWRISPILSPSGRCTPSR